MSAVATGTPGGSDAPAHPALLVSDLGGTLVADPGLVVPALRAALAEVGVHRVSDAALAAVRGRDKRAAIAELLGAAGVVAEQVSPALEAFTARVLDDVRSGRYAPLPGAGEVLAAARRTGLHVAVTTGFPVEVRDALIDHVGWDVWLCARVSGEEVARGRPAPDLILEAMRRCGVDDAGQVANVGDTASDLASGRAAGVGWNLAVLSGAHGVRQLDAGPHDVVVADLAGVGRAIGVPLPG